MEKVSIGDIDLLIKEVRKGRDDKGDIVSLRERKLECPRVSTGCMVIDSLIGGGLPIGRIIELFGNESSGKTTVALTALASMQNSGGVGAIVDTEHALDLDYADKIGVDCDRLILSQPDSGEAALDITKALMLKKTSTVGIDTPMIIVVDSAAALASSDELEKKAGDKTYSPVASLLSQQLRRLRGVIAKNNTILLFTNQMRDRVGVFFGSPSKSTGGRALKFYSSIRIELRTGSKLRQSKSSKVIIGQGVYVNIPKNKTARPYTSGEIRIIAGHDGIYGIDTVYSLFSVGVDLKIIKKSGSFYSFGKVRCKGENSFIKRLRSDDSLTRLISRRVSKAI